MFRIFHLGPLFQVCCICLGSSAADRQPAATSAAASLQTAGNAAPSTNPAADANPKLLVIKPSEIIGSASPKPLVDALALYRSGNFASSIEKYQEVLRQDPKSPDAYAGLARVYLKQKNISLASDTVTNGLKVSDSPSLRVALGEVYFREGKIFQAEQEWVNLINSGHRDARAFLGLARVKDSISMYKKGKMMIDKAHELDPDDPDIGRRWIGTLKRSERIKYLENYLAGPNDDDAEDRVDTLRYLDYLKARAKLPGHGCHLVSNVTSTDIPLVRLLIDPSHLRGYGLAVQVNDKKTKLMLDTGASGILLDRGAAEKAGITKLTEASIAGIGDKGRKNGYVGLAKSIKVGGLEFQNCSVEVLENRSVVGEEGLIGADVFEDFLVDIDFPKEKFRLHELPKRPEDTAEPTGLHVQDEDLDSSEGETNSTGTSGATKNPTAPAIARFHDAYIAPEMKSYTRFLRFGHELLIPTKVGDTPIKLFLLDTGSLTNQITPKAAREVTKIHGDSDTIIQGISGSVKNVYSADKAMLQFGHIRQENQDLIAFDLTSVSEDTGTEVSGILGFVMLRFLDIKIDYRDGLMDCSYDPQLWGR